jgi:hypothetical protein
MLSEIFQEIGQAIRESFTGLGSERVKITVARPYCIPCRIYITGTLPRYGVKILDLKERTVTASLGSFLRHMRIERKERENINKNGLVDSMLFPMGHQADVWVKPQQAVWAEYLLLRTGKLYRVGEYLDPRNQEWAARHGGHLPPSWGEKPWIDKSCSEGMSKWKAVHKALSHRKQPKAKPPNLWG